MAKNKGLGGVMVEMFSPKQADNGILALILVLAGIIGTAISLMFVGNNINYSALGLSGITGGTYRINPDGVFTTLEIATQGQMPYLVGVGVGVMTTVIQIALFIPGKRRPDAVAKLIGWVGLLFLAAQLYDYGTTGGFLLRGVVFVADTVFALISSSVNVMIILMFTGAFFSFGSEFWLVYSVTTIVINIPAVIVLFTGDEKSGREFAQVAANFFVARNNDGGEDGGDDEEVTQPQQPRRGPGRPPKSPQQPQAPEPPHPSQPQRPLF